MNSIYTQPFAFAFLLILFLFLFLCKGVRDCTRCLNILSFCFLNIANAKQMRHLDDYKTPSGWHEMMEF